MHVIPTIQNYVVDAVKAVFDHTLAAEELLINTTKKDFKGEYTLVTFPLSKALRKKPLEIAQQLGEWLVDNNESISDQNCIQGFLNLSFTNSFWHAQVARLKSDPDHWKQPKNGKKIVVEFSSPNTNKPLHLGHIRNILLGWSCAQIHDALGYEVHTVQIINDRGIAICKSMVAWTAFADGATPDSSGIKSDHFVGKWYVRFEKEFQKEYAAWQTTEKAEEVFKELGKEEEDQSGFYKRIKNQYFNKYSELGKQARKMLVAWEAEDPETRALWEKMNGWVYQGFETTYDRLGVTFDKLYFESKTYLLGKDLIEQGIQDEVFFKKDDGSVWVDLEDVGMDQKILLRSDGTSVYITQDIGTAELRYQDFGAEKMVYTVADEQNYHFRALFETIKKLKRPYADGLFHLSYGMVDLPDGKMKSREGTVVDADDLIASVIGEARNSAEERGLMNEMSDSEKEEILYRIGLGALKFFMIKVDPKKRMLFDPKASVDMQGQTGPYIQNAYVRIQSILRKANKMEIKGTAANYVMSDHEKVLATELVNFGHVVDQAGKSFEPSLVANFCYNLAKEFHRYYHDFRILKAESEDAMQFRLELISIIAHILKSGMNLLGIQMPNRM